MDLNGIYHPVREELKGIERVLAASLSLSGERSVLDINRFLLRSPGKRLRPALAALAARAAARPSLRQRRVLVDTAAAIELIHMASLVHDDTIDKSALRHHRPTVNSRWGSDVSIAAGDYLYALAFDLVARSADRRMLKSMSAAAASMCEGEILQLRERKNSTLSKDLYLRIIEKKTARLFGVACETGAYAVSASPRLRRALRGYGEHLGMAFQIVDDYRDVAATKEKLGKLPGQDIAVGEFTLPLLSLFESVDKKEARQLRRALGNAKGEKALEEIRRKMSSADVASRIRGVVASYIRSAKRELGILPESSCRRSLSDLADAIGDFR